MKLLDASSVINLVNGGVFEIVVGIEECQFTVGPAVRKECSSVEAELEEAVGRGSVELLADDAIEASTFLAALARHKLGVGETECLVAADALNASVCCDDNAARGVISKQLGSDRVVGTIGLLKRAVAHHTLQSSEAHEAYEQMRARGGFLPVLDPNYFQLPPRAAKPAP